MQALVVVLTLLVSACVGGISFILWRTAEMEKPPLWLGRGFAAGTAAGAVVGFLVVLALGGLGLWLAIFTGGGMVAGVLADAYLERKA
jgi:hypothetical protein